MTDEELKKELDFYGETARGAFWVSEISRDAKSDAHSFEEGARWICKQIVHRAHHACQDRDSWKDAHRILKDASDKYIAAMDEKLAAATERIKALEYEAEYKERAK